MNKNIKLKRDIILILSCVIIAAAAFLVINFVVKKNGSYAVVKVDGKVVKTLQLDKDATYKAEGYQGGYNNIIIESGKVSMTDADCPDELCVKTGWISKTGQSIVCLPHRVVVEIKGDIDTDGIDSVVR